MSFSLITPHGVVFSFLFFLLQDLPTECSLCNVLLAAYTLCYTLKAIAHLLLGPWVARLLLGLCKAHAFQVQSVNTER